MITAILGPMFSSKSTELLRYLERAVRGKKKVCLLRPKVDSREFFSHSPATELMYKNLQIPIFYILDDGVTPTEVLEYQVVGIDEAQFLPHLKQLVTSLNAINVDVYLSGLLATSECVIFQPIADVLPYCDRIDKLNAVCIECGSDLANYTFYKKGKKTSAVEVGDGRFYDSRCWRCYSTPDEVS